MNGALFLKINLAEYFNKKLKNPKELEILQKCKKNFFFLEISLFCSKRAKNFTGL